MLSHPSHISGHGDSMLGMLLLLGVVAFVVLLVVTVVILVIGTIAWQAFKKDFPEIAEFKPLGLVSFLTLGLPLFGIWPYLLLNRKRLKSDPELWNLLRVPLGWYAASLVGGPLWICLAPTQAARLFGSGLMMLIGIVISILLITGGSNSTDARFREVGKYSLRVLLGGVVVAGMFAIQFLCKGHTLIFSIVGFISGLVSIAAYVYLLYSWLRKNLALLLAATRSMPETRTGVTTLHLSVLYLVLFSIAWGVLIGAHALP